MTANRFATAYAYAAAEAGCPRDQMENFARAGVALTPRQLAMAAMARQCDMPDGPTRVGVGGARGGGKSHWAIAQAGADDCQRAPGLKVLLLRKVGKAAIENFEDLRVRLLGSLPHKYTTKGILTFANGSRIIVGHYQAEKDIDNYLGLEYDDIIVEEATTLTSAKLKDIATCNRTSRRDWRPRIYLTFNPGGVGHASIKLEFVTPYLQGKVTGSRFVPSLADDNPFLDAEYIKANLDTLIGWKLRAWRYGDWDISAGQYFTNWRADRIVREIDFGFARRLRRCWLSMDYGHTHYTTAYLLGEDGDGDVYLLDEHAERQMLPARHAPAIHAMVGRHGLSVAGLSERVGGWDFFSDRGGYTVAGRYAELGIELEAANDDRVAGATHILNLFGDGDREPEIPSRIHVSTRCARFIECIPTLEHDPHRPEDVLKVDCDEDGIGGDDAYDGARYGLMAAYGAPGHATAGGERGSATADRPSMLPPTEAARAQFAMDRAGLSRPVPGVGGSRIMGPRR